ncbi:hypothetical protein B5V89_02340 [Heyndrickxia sporothermodurans]|nr:hypothetical protein B5V89_02340 [Heyndrickxia sporothermodurans]
MLGKDFIWQGKFALPLFGKESSPCLFLARKVRLASFWQGKFALPFFWQGKFALPLFFFN